MAAGVVPVVIFTAFWGVIGIVLPFFVPKGQNRGLIQLMLPLTSVCCWLFWFCAYLAQINPLMGPVLHTNILAILQREWPYTPA